MPGWNFHHCGTVYMKWGLAQSLMYQFWEVSLYYDENHSAKFSMADAVSSC